MAIAKSDKKRSDLPIFFSQNFGVLATLLSIIFFALRVLQVSGRDTNTAAFILAHAEKLPLLVSLILPIIPMACVFLAFMVVRITFSSETLAPNLIHQYGAYVSIPLFIVGVQTGGWSVLLVGLIFAIIYLDIPIIYAIKRLRKNGDTLQKRVPKIFRGGMEDIMILSMIFILGTFIFPAYNSWVPRECILLTDASRIAGTVISSDSMFTYVVRMPDNKSLVLRTRDIEKREVQEVDTKFPCSVPNKK